MVMSQSAQTPEVYRKSEGGPEWSAVRNIILENPQCDFVLVGGSKRYEHFKDGKLLFYNIGTGNKVKFLMAMFLRCALPIFMKPTVIVDVGGPPSLIPPGIASFFTRARFIPVVIGSIEAQERSLNLPRGISEAYLLFLRACFKKAYTILAISESVKSEIINNCKVTPDKILVHRFKISERFNPHVSKSLKAVFNPNGPIVLTVARISPEKGLHYLVEASRTIVKKIPNVKFVIQPYSSDEKYKKHLLTMINKFNLESHFLIFTEKVPYSEIPRYMAAADVFVLPSLTEGLGMVILEAMACGIPVVAFRVGGIPEILTSGYNGLLVDPGDTEGLANSIIKLLLSEELRKNLSKSALATTEKSRENEFESLLKKLIFAK
jgi:glycosyltransferase involved in cell wall biosynthesis